MIPILYHSPGACSLAPHIVLEELGIPYRLERIAIAEGQHLSADYLAINPRGRVPVLRVDDGVFGENVAILTYLALLKPESGLLPAPGTLAFGRTLEWAGWLASTLHIAFAHYWRPERFLPAGADSAAMTDFALASIETLFGEIEGALGESWLVGDLYTIADPYLLVFYRWGNRVGLPMAERFPAWRKWVRRMFDRPAVARAVEAEGIADF